MPLDHVAEVIAVEAPHNVDGQTRRRVLDAYCRDGYAVFEFRPAPHDPSESLVAFSRSLGLGEPFVPPLYAAGPTRHLYDAAGVNVLSASVGRPAENGHPAFESRGPLEFHTDGTLHAIGEIPSAVLFCVMPAERGGDTTLFRAADAFTLLAVTHPSLALALCDDRALRRFATVNNSTEMAFGPVFTVRDGDVLSRYSVTPRDQWGFDEVAGLRDAHQILGRLAAPGSPFWTCARLTRFQGILFANDKISHGRTAFKDGEVSRRMLRALFLKRPSESHRDGQMPPMTETTNPERRDERNPAADLKTVASLGHATQDLGDDRLHRNVVGGHMLGEPGRLQSN